MASKLLSDAEEEQRDDPRFRDASEDSVTRTPLGRVVATLAAVQTVAWRRGVSPAVVRADRAEARERAARRADSEAPLGGRAVTRRAFLVGAGATAVWLVAPPDWLEAATPPASKKAPARTPPPAVAVVGAGLGGLCAALTLHDAGVPVTVYDAARQVGGRVHSNGSGYWRDGQVSEWCGELINTDHQTVLRLARRFGLPTVDLHVGQAPGAEDAYHVLGALYPVADADREFQAVRVSRSREYPDSGPPPQNRSWSLYGSRSYPLRLFHSSMNPPFFDQVLGQLQAHRQLADLGPRQGRLAFFGIAPALQPAAAGLQEDALPAFELMRGHLALAGDGVQRFAAEQSQDQLHLPLGAPAFRADPGSRARARSLVPRTSGPASVPCSRARGRFA